MSFFVWIDENICMHFCEIMLFK